MSRVAGDVYLVGPWAKDALAAPDVGVYTGHRTREIVSDVACPYCREPMMEAFSPDPRRIMKILERHADTLLVMGQPIPTTHRLFGCYGCRVSFTAPKRPDVVSQAVTLQGDAA